VNFVLELRYAKHYIFELLRLTLKINLILLFSLAFTNNAMGGILMSEYESDFNLDGMIFSSKVAIADFDNDGIDDIILSDDYGSFHIFALHDGEFVELWISDPLGEDYGAIRWLGAIEGDDDRECRIYLLDTYDILHRFNYKGYVFSETAQWQIQTEGNFIDAAVIHPVENESDEFLLLAMLPGQRFIVETYDLSGEQAVTTHGVGVTAPLMSLPGFAVWGGGLSMSLMTIREATTPEGKPEKSYLLKMVTKDDETLEIIQLKEYNPLEEAITEVALDEDGSILAIGFSLAEETGFLDFRIWREGSDKIATPGNSTGFVAHRDIVTGDIDGDGLLEFVTLGIDGLVRILSEEKLSYIVDGQDFNPSLPGIVEQGEIFQNRGFLEAIGIDILEESGKITFRSGSMSISFIKEEDIWVPETGDCPPVNILTDPYGNTRYPLSRICIDLGYAFRYRSDTGVVEVLS